MLHSLATTYFTLFFLYSNNNALQTFYNQVGIISCNSTEDCEIICNEINGCRNAQINCPHENSCNIICSATSSCNGLIINATHSSLLTMNNCNTGYFPCKGISIYLPPNNNGIPRAIIYNADNGLSQGGGINSTYDGEPIQPIHFYATHGWNDINIVNYSGTFQYHGGIMHCSFQYNETCIFNTNAWSCQNVNHICNHDYHTTSTTLSPQTLQATTTTYVQIEPNQFDSVTTDVKPKKKSSSPLFFMQSINTLWYIVAALLLCLCCIGIILMYYIMHSYRLQKHFYDKIQQTTQQIKELSTSQTTSTVSNTYTPNTPNTHNEIVHIMDTIDEDKAIGESYSFHSYKKRTANITYSTNKSNPIELSIISSDNSDSMKLKSKPVNYPWMQYALSPSNKSMDVDDIQLSPIQDREINYGHMRHTRNLYPTNNMYSIPPPPPPPLSNISSSTHTHMVYNVGNVPSVSLKSDPINNLKLSMQLQPIKPNVIDQTPISATSDLSAISSSDSDENINSNENKNVSKNQSDSMSPLSRSNNTMMIVSENDESVTSNNSSYLSDTDESIDTTSNVVQHKSELLSDKSIPEKSIDNIL
eukprot:542321_1